MIETKLPRVLMFSDQFWSKIGGAERQAAKARPGVNQEWLPCGNIDTPTRENLAA